MTERQNNFAFIDTQNLYLGIRDSGWKLDYRRFRVYLAHKYHVTKAYLFIGFLPENQDLYTSLKEFGYVLVFKPVLENKGGHVKGNVDAELVLQGMIDYNEYDKAVIVTSDGDFYCLVKYLYEREKLEKVISPNRDKCSALLKMSAKDRIVYMNNLQEKLAYHK